MNLQRQYEASHPVLHRRDYLACPQPSNNALCSFESIHNSEAILWPPETLHYDNRYGQAKETCSIMKVKDNLNHHFLNLISDDGLFSSRYDKKNIFTSSMYLSQQKRFQSLYQVREQRDPWCADAVSVQIRSSAENNCPLLTNSTLMKGQKTK